MWPLTFGIRTYTPVYVLSMVVHAAIAIWLCRRRGVSLWFGALLGVAYVFGMVVGAKVLWDVLHGEVHWRRYFSIKHYTGGGLWGGPLAYLMIAVPYALARRGDWRNRLDIVALALPVPLLLAKVACFANGCCYGHECSWPWAVSMRTGAEAPVGIPRHPTELYEVFVAFVILVAFAALDRERWKGSFILWFGMIYGLGRPLTEVFRGDGPRVANFGPFTGSQATCLAGAALSGIILVAIWLRRTRHHPAMIG